MLDPSNDNDVAVRMVVAQKNNLSGFQKGRGKYLFFIIKNIKVSRV